MVTVDIFWSLSACLKVCENAHCAVNCISTFGKRLSNFFVSLPSGAFNPTVDEPQPGHRKTQLILKIISGQQLPKPRDSMLGDRGEVKPTCWGWSNPHTPGKLIKMWLLLMFLCFQIIDPFVEVEIIGLPVDCSKQQTRVIDDNGLRTCSYCNAHKKKKKQKQNQPTATNLLSDVI